jgi:hypothetical protein
MPLPYALQSRAHSASEQYVYNSAPARRAGAELCLAEFAYVNAIITIQTIIKIVRTSSIIDFQTVPGALGGYFAFMLG